MGRITRLPDDLANQIAAGEVVERPASVIKELVENAIDAEATRITITTEYGGKKLIRVEDDGVGMDPDDARLCLERHATSKIRRADDLGAIVTLGFRGEALPSMASVSHFRLRTRPRGSPSGTEIRVNAGVLESVVEAGGPEGTLVEVADLFYNLPARRKFLKSDGAESAQISKTVTQLALCYPRVGFVLTNAGRKVLSCPPVTSVSDRLYQLYGDRPDLLPVERESGGIRIHGFVAALAEHGPTRGPQHVFVNRRIVKDKTIAHAIFDAYSVASNKERSPEVHLFLEVPPDRIDVNVHPTKAEVRFKEQSLVHEIVRRAVGDALGRSGVPELVLRTSDVLPGRPIAQTIPGVLGGGYYPNRWTTPIPSAAPAPTSTDAPAAAWRSEPVAYDPSGTAPRAAAGGLPADTAVAAAIESGQATPATPTLRPLIPLGQFRDTFIIAIDDEGIAIIDQHVAHERVLFERVMQRLTERPLESQGLLVPILLELAPAEHQALVERAAALSRFGFEVEDFGGDAIRVSAIPAILPREECDAALRALATDLEGLDRGLGIEEGLKRIAALTACHAAVKANYPLTMEKMTHILEELRATAYSTVCPHGRPVMLRITRRELEKNFERI
ncbi:MAG: DNA mismatch repair endonuclease MutL [Acidobacteria bacterium]|nr:DNA mismatch repair endonuclease MutL [Acidobacteriota bacterium]